MQELCHIVLCPEKKTQAMSGRSLSAWEYVCVYKRSGIVLNNRLGPLSEGIPRYCIIS